MTPKLVALAAALLMISAGPAAADKKPATPKATTAAPAKVAKPAPSSRPPTEGAFDSREPANLIALLATLDAKAEIAKADNDGVILKVTTPVGGFQAQFGGCDPHGRRCGALQFDASAETKTVTIAEINRFNQSSLTCRIVQAGDGKPHVVYSALVFADDAQNHMLTHVSAWRGCLAEFGAFLKDPNGYLASAP